MGPFLLVSACSAYHLRPIGVIPETTVACHALVGLESGIGVGAIACVQDGKLVGLVGGAVEGSLAGPISVLGGLFGKAAGLMLMVTPQEMEQERNRRLAGQ